MSNKDCVIILGVLVKYTGHENDIIIPNGVKSIGEGAFKNCRSLKSITLPDSIESIGDEAFDDCVSLESIVIPRNVISVGDAAFYHCKSLREATLLNSIKNIGDYAFGRCDALSKVCILTDNNDFDATRKGWNFDPEYFTVPLEVRNNYKRIFRYLGGIVFSLI